MTPSCEVLPSIGFWDVRTEKGILEDQLLVGISADNLLLPWMSQIQEWKIPAVLVADVHHWKLLESSFSKASLSQFPFLGGGSENVRDMGDGCSFDIVEVTACGLKKLKSSSLVCAIAFADCAMALGLFACFSSWSISTVEPSLRDSMFSFTWRRTTFWDRKESRSFTSWSCKSAMIQFSSVAASHRACISRNVNDIEKGICEKEFKLKLWKIAWKKGWKKMVEMWSGFNDSTQHCTMQHRKQQTQHQMILCFHCSSMNRLFQIASFIDIPCHCLMVDAFCHFVQSHSPSVSVPFTCVSSHWCCHVHSNKQMTQWSMQLQLGWFLWNVNDPKTPFASLLWLAFP